MSTYTRENTEIAVEIDGVGQQHRAVAGGMVIALERWKAGLDTTEMFAGLPDGACQEPHFGFVLRGAATVRYSDGEVESSPGRGVLPAARPQRPRRPGRGVRRVHPGGPDAGHQHARAVRAGARRASPFRLSREFAITW